jgi:eukaryotic-like serine/threonine-protein kinase
MNHPLGDRYRLGERIAGGGMGSGYRAVDENLGRQVAVEVLRRDLADDPAFLERFRREARAAAALSHPGVAGVYDYGELGGSAFIVMELVEGETLAERIEATGRLPWREAFALGEGVARALAAAHAQGLVHRDVKPANVLVGRGGRAKVTDFGIAKAAASATLTRTGMVLGSANYVAPEQAQGDEVGPAADQYSLGCVLFEAVTGRPPYQGASAVAIATHHVSAPVPDPPHAGPPEQGARHLHPPHAGPPEQGARHPHPRDAGAPEREGSPTARGVRSAVHSPRGTGSRTARRVRLALYSPRGAGRRTLAGAVLVAIALLLLAWLPRSGRPDPPAGQSERPPPASPTTVPGDD